MQTTKARRPMVQQGALLKIAGLGFGLLVLLYLLFAPKTKPTNDFFYGIMLDAGSTGSRIHIYKFRATSQGQLLLDSEVFRHVEPGLSSYHADPPAAAQSLVALLDIALQTVPRAQQKATPINLKATAGLRLLPAVEADAILFEVRALLRRYPFYFDQADAVEVMDGDSEGLFGWVTVNYLRNSLAMSADRTAAVLDLGGGSTQIALSVAVGTGAGVALKKTSVMGQDHHMYIYSHLGYGLMAGRMGVLTLGVPASDARRAAKEPLEHVCFYPGTKVEYDYGSDKVAVVGSAESSFDACIHAASAFVKKVDGSFHLAQSAPVPAPGQPVVAMSYYFDRAIDAGLIPPSALHAELRPSLYREAARRICELAPDAVAAEFPQARKRAAFLCLDLCFISALLEDGFGLHTHAPILLAKKMEYNGEMVETAWSLGASIAEISETRQQLALGV